MRLVTGKVSTPFADMTVVLVVAWRGLYARNFSTCVSLSSADILCHTEFVTMNFPNVDDTLKFP